jgi:hypothetical protein
VGSPAQVAGLRDGDRIVAIGHDAGRALTKAASVQPLARHADVAAVIRASEGVALRVVVLRQNANSAALQSRPSHPPAAQQPPQASLFEELVLVPQRWSGNGILGCGLE